MSDLYMIGYPTVDNADAARAKVIQLNREHLIQLEDVVVVEKRGGKIKLHQANSPKAAGAIGGAFWGGLIGLIFLMPLLGAAIGAGAGAAGGAMADTGVDDNLMKRLGGQLPDGGAALFMLVRSATEDKVIAELAPLGGELLHSSLSTEAEESLKAAASAATARV